MHDNKLYVLFILIQSIVYGLGNPLTKIAYETIDPFTLLFFRFTLATLIFLLFFWKRIASTFHRTRCKTYIIPALCMSIAYITSNLALNWTTATNVGFLVSLPVIITPILATLFLKEKYSKLALVIQLTVLVGLFLLCRNGGEFSLNSGDLLALFSATTIAGSLVFGKEALKAVDAIFLSAIQCAITAAISLLGMIYLEGDFRFAEIAPIAWGVTLYLAVTCSVLGFVMQNLALTKLSSDQVAMLQCTQPIMTAAIAWCLLGELLSGEGIIGAIIIIICILVQSGRKAMVSSAVLVPRQKKFSQNYRQQK